MEKKIRIIFGIGFLICSVLLVLTLPYGKEGAIIIGILLLLSIANFQKNLFIQYIVFLVVLLLLFQTYFGNILVDRDYITLTSNTRINTIVVGDAIPGVSGLISVQTDNKGFRVSKHINYEQPAPYRIFTIGGSTTEQIYLDDRQTSSFLLQCKLEEFLKQPVEVINTGVSGLLARNHLATLKKIEKYHPNLVIIMMGANDWNRQIRNHFSKPNSVLTALRARYSFEFSPVSKLANHLYNYFKGPTAGTKVKIENGAWLSEHNNTLSRRAIKYDYEPQEVSEEFKFYTKELFTKCREGKYKTIIVSQISSYKENASNELKKYYWSTPPDEDYTLSFKSMVYLANLYNCYLEKEAKSYGFIFCEVDNIPPTTGYFYDDMHVNKKGSEILADDIFSCIVKNHLIKN